MNSATARYQEEKDRLGRTFLIDGNAENYLAAHAVLLEKTLTLKAKEASLSDSIAFLAAGSFSRYELFPFSDIDALVLIPEDLPAAEKEKISAFLTSLWDLGLSVGTAVRTPDETVREAEKDVSVSTNFLESRFLFGDKSLFEYTKSLFFQHFDAKHFFQEKKFEMLQRHRKHDETPYELEPDVKESLGGLRDIQVILWCAQAAGFGNRLEDLAVSGILTGEEEKELSAAKAFLSNLRLCLQLLSGRRENRLLFEKQIPLAQSLGIKGTSGLDAAELLMKRYYRNAHNVELLNAVAMRSLEERLFNPYEAKLPIKAITPEFLARGSTLDVADETLLENHPENFLKLFFEFSVHQELKDFSAHLMRTLYRSVNRSNPEKFKSPDCKRLFRSILESRYGCTRCLQLMNQWGILGRLIPDFGRIVGQMQHDLFHAYTVDQHTLRAIKFIRRFTHSTYAHEFPQCSQVMSEVERPELLVLAALFHDVGKGQGGHHAQIGAKAVGQFALELGYAKEDVQFVEFLVREHLTMSSVAQKKDTSDPKVIQTFSKLVGSKERLDALYLLTVADIRATNPKIWNSWKAQLLEDLYKKTLGFLSGKLQPTSKESFIKEKKNDVCKALKDTPVKKEEIDRFFKELDLAYFMRNSVEDIVWHTSALAADQKRENPVIELKDLGKGLIKIFIFLPDQTGLFSKVLYAFECNGLSVLEARIHTTHSGWALDTFLAEDKRGHVDFAEFKDTFSTRLRENLLESGKLPQTKTGRLSRRSRSFPVKPVVDIEQDASGKGWLLQIACNDRMGLLYTISLILTSYGVNMVSAKITTLDERVEDIFLIDGDRLKEPETILSIEREILRVIEKTT